MTKIKKQGFDIICQSGKESSTALKRLNKTIIPSYLYLTINHSFILGHRGRDYNNQI